MPRERLIGVRGMDMTALVNAKYRCQEQLARDEQTVNHVAAALALRLAGVDSSTFAWALTESETNRRKAGLTLNRVSLGGLFLTEDGPGSKVLPKHIFMELKRAFGKAMPPLFKEECFDYLNRIMERAR